MSRFERLTVDLQDYPDLIVIYLGMQALSPRGLVTLVKTSYDVWKMLQTKPEGLLRHENMATLNGFFSISISFGFRQYWRSFDELERWSHESVHAEWWRKMYKGTGGTMVWHESYAMRGGIEAIWASTSRIEKLGLMHFAPVIEASGSSYSARKRIHRSMDTSLLETEVYID